MTLMTTGHVYLLHFESPISDKHTCQHYTGFTDNLAARIQQHGYGGARLTEVAKERGIKFVVARVWAGGRDVEKAIKAMKNGKKLCPICNPSPKGTRFVELTTDQIEEELLGF